MPYSQHKGSEELAQSIIDKAQCGDILLIRTEGELTTSFQPSYWTHSLVCLNNKHAIEAKITGVRVSDLMYVLARCDDAKLIRPTLKIDTDKLIDYALSQTGKEYDFDFSDDGKFYCHELTSQCIYASSQIVFNKIKTPVGFKFLPESFIDSVWVKHV